MTVTSTKSTSSEVRSSLSLPVLSRLRRLWSLALSLGPASQAHLSRSVLVALDHVGITRRPMLLHGRCVDGKALDLSCEERKHPVGVVLEAWGCCGGLRGVVLDQISARCWKRVGTEIAQFFFFARKLKPQRLSTINWWRRRDGDCLRVSETAQGVWPCAKVRRRRA